jgi:ribosomal-protein-alanine N-acetyltransferase
MIVFARAGTAHTPAILTVMERAFDARFGERWNAGQVNAALLAGDRVGEIAFGDGAPIGFSLARYAAEEAELLLVAVVPQWQRRGIARMLISRAIDEVRARGAATIFLEVRDGNDAAGALYASQGFEGVGRRKGYYSGTERRRHDAITMRRCL